MLKSVLFMCLFHVTFIHSFDWSDTDFNMILQEDILDNLDVFETVDDEDLQFGHRRVVRAAEGDPTRPSSNGDCPPREGGKPGSHSRMQRSCCGEKDDLKMHGEALRKLRKGCLMEVRKLRMSKLNGEEDTSYDVFNCERVKKNREDMICVMECVAKKKNMADDEGNLLPEDVTAFVKRELATEEWQKSIIDDVLQKCLQQNASLTNATTNDSHPESSGRKDTAMKCNPASLRFSHCLWREMQLSCPNDMIKDTKLCQRMRERLEKQESPNFPKKGRLVQRKQRPGQQKVED